MWLINLLYALTGWFLFGLVTIGAWRLADRFILPGLNFTTEIKNGNLAAGVVTAAVVVGWFIGGALLLGQVLG
ncbi:MAG: DUF350 domain-containing protein [Proteobacteria bacterium]|nr:DUF350 domain-containing protein [Pseudomonadota bacterium]